MLSYKRLVAAQDILEFQRSYVSISGHFVPVSFLKSAQTIGFFSRGELVGGYVFNDSHELRSLGIVPGSVQRQILKSLNPSAQFSAANDTFAHNPSEVCCVWTSKFHRNCVNTFTSLLHIFVTCFRSSSSLIVCATSSMNHFERNFKFFTEKILYDGAAAVEGTSLERVLIFQLHKRSLLFRLPIFLVLRCWTDFFRQSVTKPMPILKAPR